MNNAHQTTAPVRSLMAAAAGLLATLLLIVLAPSALALIWDIETVDNADSGSTPGISLALDPTTGHPRIAYYDSPSTSLKYAAWNGASWDIETVDSDGYLPSLTLDPTSGYPRISYSIQTFPWGLRYAAWNGASWDIETVDSSGYSGSNSSVALDPTTGYPRISYRDAQAARLKYASWNGASWDIEFIGTANAFETSLALDPTTGYPRISYYNQTVFKLEYAAWNGASWDITAVGDGGRFSSMKLDPTTGYPRISYQNNLTFNLEYAVWDGVSWATEVVGPSSGNTSLALDPTSGYPRISTRGLTALTFSAWDGASWATENVDAAGYTPSLALDSCGNPRIAYEDAVANTLKFAAAEDACAPPATTGTITVVKDVVGGTNPQDFSYNLYYYQPQFGLEDQFQLDDDGDNTNTLSNTYSTTVSPGKYGVSEAGLSNWSIGITCESTDPNRVFPGNSYDPNNNGTGIAFDIEAGETITCTFTNTYTPPTGTIIINKVANPEDGTVFSFTDTIVAPNAFTLSSDTTLTKTFSNVPAGVLNYSVVEQDKPGWPLTALSCSGGNSSYSASLAAGSISVTELEAADTVSCTFTNTMCLPGTYDNGGNSCVPADPGNFVDSAAAISQIECAPGTWQDEEGQTSCKIADPGYFVPTPGATEQTQCPQGTTSEAGAVECTPIQSASFCSLDDAGTLRTDLLGVGMGSPTRGAKNSKITIPAWQDVDSMQAQLAAVEFGQMKWVRFRVKGYPTVQVAPPTSPAVDPGTVKWWGSGELPASPYLKGAFFWGKKGNRSPRALVVWPTYNTSDEYADVLTLFDDGSTNYVYHSVLPLQTQTLSLPPTQAAGAELTVNVALVDVNKDARSVILTVEAGGVSESRVITVPNRKNSLNVETFVLAGIAAGTDTVTITLESPAVSSEYPFGGDSAAMIGASANYACAIADDN